MFFHDFKVILNRHPSHWHIFSNGKAVEKALEIVKKSIKQEFKRVRIVVVTEEDKPRVEVIIVNVNRVECERRSVELGVEAICSDLISKMTKMLWEKEFPGVAFDPSAIKHIDDPLKDLDL